MKKIIILFLSGIVLMSCEKTVEINSSAMQARINNSFWKTSNQSAVKSATGALTLTGSSAVGTVTFHTSAAIKGTYILGSTNLSDNVSYVTTEGHEFTTDVTSGGVNKVLISSAGSNYTTATAVATTGGSGSGLKIDIVRVSASNGVAEVKVSAPGNGYMAGDVITITGGAGNAKIRVQNVISSNGEVVITENDGTTISGKFKFTAFDAETGETAVCRDGIFYKVPLN